MKLEDKLVVVTGASQGIGRQIALSCAAEGADVVLAARSVDAMVSVAAEIENSGRAAQVVETDLTDRASVEALGRAVLDRWNRVDVLVNNSGIGGPAAPIWEVPPDEWDETLAVNVTGIFSMCQVFVPAMIECGDGSIVNIGSIGGKRPLLNRAAYTTSKAALIGLTRSLAEELGPHGIRANLISPGAVEGPRIEWVFEQQAIAQNRSIEEIRAQFEAGAPLRQLVRAEDIAKMVVFLGSEDAARITGADMNVTAGMVMY